MFIVNINQPVAQLVETDELPILVPEFFFDARHREFHPGQCLENSLLGLLRFFLRLRNKTWRIEIVLFAGSIFVAGVGEGDAD